MPDEPAHWRAGDRDRLRRHLLASGRGICRDLRGGSGPAGTGPLAGPKAADAAFGPGPGVAAGAGAAVRLHGAYCVAGRGGGLDLSGVAVRSVCDADFVAADGGVVEPAALAAGDRGYGGHGAGLHDRRGPAGGVSVYQRVQRQLYPPLSGAASPPGRQPDRS